GEPRLSDARFAGDQHGRAAPRLRSVEHALELSQLVCAPDEHGSSISRLGRPGAEIRIPAEQDKALCPMRAGGRVVTIGVMSTLTDTTKQHTVTGGGGLRLHVREWGRASGPPILFIHGWSQNHLCWAKQYESDLADQFRLV